MKRMRSDCPAQVAKSVKMCGRDTASMVYFNKVISYP